MEPAEDTCEADHFLRLEKKERPPRARNAFRKIAFSAENTMAGRKSEGSVS